VPLWRAAPELLILSKVSFPPFKTGSFMLGTILIIVLILLLLGAWPAWPYSRGWGYYPSGLLGVVLIVILVLVLLGRF
jgi:hypothetical protein